MAAVTRSPTSARREVRERHQDETTLPHPRVWDLEIGLVNGQVAHEEHVDVKGARPPTYVTGPPGGSLGLLAGLEQLARRCAGPELGDQVEVRALPGRTAHRLGLIERGHRDDIGQVCQPCSQVSQAVAEVGAEPDKGLALQGLQIRTAAEARATGTGGLSLRTVTTTPMARSPATARARLATASARCSRSAAWSPSMTALTASQSSP